jgi:hypothetical protein
MRSICFALFLLVLPVSAVPKQARLPNALMNAQSVYIVDKTHQHVPLEEAYRDFDSWKRFTIAKTKGTADVVVVLTAQFQASDGPMIPWLTLSIYAPNNPNDALFKVTRMGVREGTRECIKELKKRLEQQS